MIFFKIKQITFFLILRDVKTVWKPGTTAVLNAVFSMSDEVFKAQLAYKDTLLLWKDSEAVIQFQLGQSSISRLIIHDRADKTTGKP